MQNTARLHSITAIHPGKRNKRNDKLGEQFSRKMFP